MSSQHTPAPDHVGLATIVAIAEHERECWDKPNGPVYRLRQDLQAIEKQLARYGGAVALALILLSAAVILMPFVVRGIVAAPNFPSTAHAEVSK